MYGLFSEHPALRPEAAPGGLSAQSIPICSFMATSVRSAGSQTKVKMERLRKMQCLLQEFGALCKHLDKRQASESTPSRT